MKVQYTFDVRKQTCCVCHRKVEYEPFVSNTTEDGERLFWCLLCYINLEEVRKRLYFTKIRPISAGGSMIRRVQNGLLGE